jgi:hypothetical protein
LFSAIGATVYYSQPFVYGVAKPNNFYAFAEPVVMVCGIETGLFVGTRRGVYFIQNAGSEKASVRQVASSPVLSHSFQRVSGEGLGLSASEVVVWMTEAGIQFGLADGSVQTPQAGHVRFQGPHEGHLMYHDGVFYYLQRG